MGTGKDVYWDTLLNIIQFWTRDIGINTPHIAYRYLHLHLHCPHSGQQHHWQLHLCMLTLPLSLKMY